MAKSKGKPATKGGIRRIRNKKDRSSGNIFTRLKTDEWLKGYALFTPDPEITENNPYIEYQEHYDKPNNQYVPCTEDDCYVCAVGENPSGRALTLWYFPDNPEKERFKVFKLNGYLIRDFEEIQEEEGGVLGRRFRVKRLSEKGEYRVSPQQDKPLTKKEIAKLLKEASELGLDSDKLEAMLLTQAKNAAKKASAADTLTDVDTDDDEDDDEDEEEEETPKARPGKEKGKKNSKSDDDDDDDDEDEEDDEDEDEDEDSDDDDSDDEDEDDDEEDDDSDDDDDDDEDDDTEDEEDDEDEDNSSMSKQTFKVESANESDETITVKMDGKKTVLYVGTGLEVDFDKVKKGAEITVDATKDDEGDWVLTKVIVKKAKGKK